MKKLKFIEKIDVTSPCNEHWNEMIGNEQIRFCSHCAKNVNNISEMTRKQAMRLVRQNNGQLCVRYYTDPTTNRPVFLDTLHKITRRSPRVAAGVMATSFAVATASYAQSTPQTDPQTGTQIELKTEPETSSLSGYVTDPKGSVIPFAVVTLINEKTFSYRAANASFEGFYEFKDIEPGEYTIKFEGGGFEPNEMKGVSISGGTLRRDAQLAIQGVSETVEVTPRPRYSEIYNSCAGDCVMVEPSSPLVQAVYSDDLEEVKARVIMRAKVNVRDKAYNGITPLHAAVENGNIEIIQFLLDSGAKVNIRDFEKRTPLMMLDNDATPEIFDLLIRYGAKIQLVDKEKNTALHHFVESADNAEIVQLLINHGVDVNAVNKDGETALMLAAENGNAESVKALLESGADVTKLNAEKKSAQDVASGDDVRQMLESYGAVAQAKQ